MTETVGVWYRRGQCPVCGKTAERQKELTKAEYLEWCKEPVRHKRCEGLCKHCGQEIKTPAELDADPYTGCTGVQTMGADPYLYEIEDDFNDYMLCHGQRQIRADDI